MHSAATARYRGDAELPKVSPPGCKLLLLCPHVVTKHFLAILLKKKKKTRKKHRSVSPKVLSWPSPRLGVCIWFASV